MTDNDTEEMEFQNPATRMQNATMIIGFIAFAVYGWVWGGEGMYNNFMAWGGWLWLGVFMMFKWGPMVIGLRSPKFSSNKIGSTIASPDPLTTVPPQGGYPEMALYPPGSVMAMAFFDIKISTKALVWAPTSLIYVLGEQDRGVNVVVNCHLEKLAERSELAPHLLEATNRVTRVGFKENLPIYVGLFPLLTNNLPPERLHEYRKRFADLGISKEAFDGQPGKKIMAEDITDEKVIVGVSQILEQYANETSRFRYGPEFTKPEQMQATIIKSQNSMIATLKTDNKFFKSEISALHELHRFSRDTVRDTSWKDKLPFDQGQQQQQQNNQDNRGG